MTGNVPSTIQSDAIVSNTPCAAQSLTVCGSDPLKPNAVSQAGKNSSPADSVPALIEPKQGMCVLLFVVV